MKARLANRREHRANEEVHSGLMAIYRSVAQHVHEAVEVILRVFGAERHTCGTNSCLCEVNGTQSSCRRQRNGTEK